MSGEDRQENDMMYGTRAAGEAQLTSRLALRRGRAGSPRDVAAAAAAAGTGRGLEYQCSVTLYRLRPAAAAAEHL